MSLLFFYFALLFHFSTEEPLINKNTTNRRLNKIYTNLNSISSLIKYSQSLSQKLINCQVDLTTLISANTKRQEEQFYFASSAKFYQYMTNLRMQVSNFFK